MGSYLNDIISIYSQSRRDSHNQNSLLQFSCKDKHEVILHFLEALQSVAEAPS